MTLILRTKGTYETDYVDIFYLEFKLNITKEFDPKLTQNIFGRHETNRPRMIQT